MAEGLKAAHGSLAELRKILSPSFGPWGKDVLLRTNTGSIFVTKNGQSIIQMLEVSHPIGGIIKKSVEQYANLHGDFSKTYVIILSHLTSMLFQYYVNRETSRTVKDLHVKLASIIRAIHDVRLSLSHGQLNQYIKSKLQEENYCVKKSIDTCIDGLQCTFFTSRFNSTTGKLLKKLLMDLFKAIPVTMSNLTHITDCFDAVCIKVFNLPLHFSRVVEGVILERECSLRDADIKICNFILISGNLSRTGKNLTINLNAENLVVHEDSVKKFYAHLINILTSNNITTVLTEDALPKHLELLLTQHDIVYVSHLQECDLKRLCDLYEISLLSGLDDIRCLGRNANGLIGCASFFKECVLGTRRCCHLGPSPIHGNPRNIQLLLCATSDGIGVQYYEAIHNFLKTLRWCFDDDHLSCSVIPACGAFEVMVCDFLREQFFAANDAVQKDVLKMICTSLIEIPTLIYKNSGKTTGSKFHLPLIKLCDFVQSNVSSAMTNSDCASPFCKTSNELCKLPSIPGVNGSSGCVINACEENLFEPLRSKILLLGNLLELCCQIVRIEMIVPVRKKVPENQLDSSDEE